MDIKNMDVNILYSIINLKLRDNYSNLEALVEDMDIKKDELIEKLKSGDFHYIEEENTFR
ncbi:MAG: DUF4250 domain-containing protein [Clostridium sp.]|uniref:DUF4250 domain-containing protein n=1 Tax=Clostridium sp. TaxID=1506 RepID=UPI003F331519